MEIEMRTTRTAILLYCMLCGVTLFVFSHRFVNAEITPKWLVLMPVIGVIGMLRNMPYPGVFPSVKSASVIITGCCVVVFVREWTTSGFNPILLTHLTGLVLLFFLIRQAVTTCPSQYPYGTVMFFAMMLSLHGIFQHAGVLSSANSNFAVTGGFDNPSGFASALVCVFPLCFYFLRTG